MRAVPKKQRRQPIQRGRMLGDLRIEEYRGADAFRALAADWHRLYFALPTRVHSTAYEAHLAYFETLMATPERFRCLVVSDDSGRRALCPLEARVDRLLGIPVPVWGVPVHPHLPFADILCGDDEVRPHVIPLVLKYLQSRPEGRHLFTVGPVAATSQLWTGLNRLPRWSYAIDTPWQANYFDCSQGVESLVARFSKSFRTKVRKAERRLSTLPDASFTTAASADALAAAFTTFLDVEASGWKGANGTRTAVRFRTGQPEFFRRLALPLGGGDGCEINSLYAEGKCIATHYCVRSGEDYAILKSGYDESYARFSPGRLLRLHTLTRCCDDPTIRRCSLVSDYDWQQIWNPESMAVRTVYIAVGGTASGRTIAGLYRFRLGSGRRAARWLRARTRRPPTKS